MDEPEALCESRELFLWQLVRFHVIVFTFGAVLNNCFGLLFSVKNAQCFGFSV